MDEKQLVSALKTKQILGAGMDVYELEPIKKDKKGVINKFKKLFD